MDALSVERKEKILWLRRQEGIDLIPVEPREVERRKVVRSFFWWGNGKIKVRATGDTECVPDMRIHVSV